MKKIIIIIALIALSYVKTGFKSHTDAMVDNVITDNVMDSNTYEVVSVADGDTFKIKYQEGVFPVRMIGIDTPESCHATDSSRNTAWGKKASKYTKNKLTGKTVYLSFDKEKYDRYGRLLAYVYVKNSKGKKIMYNKTLVKKGYARAVCYEPNHKYKKVFNKLQKQAKKGKKGFWKDGYHTAFPK